MDVITVISAGKALNGPSLVAIDHVLGVDLLWCLCVDHALAFVKATIDRYRDRWSMGCCQATRLGFIQ